MMISYADMYLKPNYPAIIPFTLPLYDTYFFTRDEGVIWSDSRLSAIVKVVAYFEPQTVIDFERLDLTDDQLRVIEIAREIRRRREMTLRSHMFCYDVMPHFYKTEMQKLKEHLDAVREIEPRYIDNPETVTCPACEQSVNAGVKILQLPDNSVCCNWDCYAVILAREHDHGD